MPITYTPVRSNQALATGDDRALAIEEFNGMVESVLQTESQMDGWIEVQTAEGTDEITKKAIGSGSIQTVTIGVTPDGVPLELNKISVKIEKHLLYRHILGALDIFQTDFDVRSKIAQDGGRVHAEFFDEAIYIQAIKAARTTTNPYGITGFQPGSVETLAAVGDEQDPALLYAAICNLNAKMQGKRADLARNKGMIVVGPNEFNTLFQNELLINSNYVTAQGNKVEGGAVLKALGIPVVQSVLLPDSVVTGHPLGTSYDGDYSKVKVLMFAPKAVFAAQNFGIRSDSWYEKKDLAWYVDCDRAFGATPDRVEFAGIVEAV